MEKIKKISIAGWFAHHEEIIDFLNYYYDHPEFFFQDRIIDSIYDCYYGNLPLVWCGGRVPNNDVRFNMNYVLKNFNMFPNIKLRHNFTNKLLNDDALINDYRCNQFVKKYIRPQDEVVINHPKLIQHFKEHYPQIPLIYSTTLEITDINQVNEITKNNIYVLSYTKNNDIEYLKNLQYKDNIELLCGETCMDNCPYRKEHQRMISQTILDAQLDLSKMQEINCPTAKEHGAPFFINDILQRDHAISNEKMDQLMDLGFSQFKIVGRSFPVPMWLDILLYYLALPEYKERLKQEFLMRWWKE